MNHVRICLSGTYQDGPSQARPGLGRGARHRFRFDQFLELTERLRHSRRIDTVLIDHRSDFNPGGFAAVEGIRKALESLKDAGKDLIFCCEDCDALTLYLASVCPTRVVHPAGEVRMLGFARRFVFFRKLLDREDLRAHVIRRGRYKTAGDPVRTDSLDPLNREQYEAFYGEVHRRVVTTIASSLGKTQQDVEVLVAGHILPAEQAVEHGWMTEVATVHEVARRLEDEKRKERRLKLHGKWGRGPRVALLFLDGAIWSGESRRHPLWGSTSGDRSLAGEIRKLAKDKRTKAVVLRVNSPGGSAVASESVRRELSYLREKKPLAVSMANVAGSGGYWVSVEGERIFAEGLTLTGSIGVIMVLLEGESALKRRGITSDVVRTGPHAEIGSPFRRATSEEQHILDTRVEQFYQDFLSRVANARNRTKEAIEEVAAGRVWSGTAAREASLVDEVGGIDAALSYLRERLGAKRLSVRVHPEVKRSLVERFVLRNIPRTSATGEPGMAEPHGGAVFPIGSLSPATFAAAREAVSELQGHVLAVVPEPFFEGLAPRG